MSKSINVWTITIGYRPSGNMPHNICLVSDKEPTFEIIKKYWYSRNHGVPLEDHKVKNFNQRNHHIFRIEYGSLPIVDDTEPHEFHPKREKLSKSNIALTAKF